MAFTLKPADLEKAKSASDIQKKMKADLKSSVGKKNVKFVAAKNAVIGGKTVQLFIPTDNPTAFETVLKTKYPKAYRAKGTCDIEKDTQTGATKVNIKSSSGQMAADAVGRLIPLAVAGDKSFQVTFPAVEKAKLLDQIKNAAALKKTTAPDTGGIPEWAKQEYLRESVETVIASMTSDKKIGSIYFGKEGRIRTTHGSGPQKSEHGNQTTLQFNIDRKQAWQAFLKDNPKTPQKTAGEDYKKWIKSVLGNARPDSQPSWAKMVKGPSTAMDVGSGAPTDDTQLIEIFKGINGKVEGWHPSRGAAVKFVTDKQAISVLRAAIKHIDGLGLKGAGERNKAFYDFVKSRLPKFAPLMRDPGTVKTKT